MKQWEHREYEPPNNDVSAGQESEYDPRNEPQPHALYNIRDPPQHAQQQYYHTERRTRANATATGTVYYHVTDRHEDAHEPGGGRLHDYPHSHVEHRHVHLEDVLHRHRHEPYEHDSNEYHVRSLAPVPGAPSAAVGKTRQAVAW